ncbi:cytochrome P450 [Coniophora puteana RWD-64-598 SS2]|uniref:Cytochrome P450 n=1 Tax=Coniophora puteana (strain RWD-64-598) TaxID=741705 RepID=A0A5M3N2F1_CONPW|nr:cytochrome P450 [Coniophora puteana RWD-64-598 SS2]EIW85486.1 cytochrome P450 [Coniophora puteana RWD-64-598 SS2]
MNEILSDPSPSLLASAAAVATVALYAINKTRERSARNSALPPGPPAEWFWKKAIPAKDTHLALAEWTNQYGPVFTVRQGNNITIVVGRMQAAIDIMERQGGVTLSRPEAVVGGTMLSQGRRLLMRPAGDVFKRMRNTVDRAVHEPLQPKVAKTYSPVQFEAGKNFVLNILERPDLFSHFADLYATAVTLKITYGKSAPSTFDDPDVVRIHKITARFLGTLKPGIYLAERFPWLQHVPGYAPEIKQYREEELALFQEQVNKTRVSMGEKSERPSFVKYMLENPEAHGLDGDTLAYLAGSLYGAGSETTAVGITRIIMAAALHPQAQEKMVTEIDTLIGDRDLNTTTAPTCDDMGHLPQLDAFVQEALRWRPIVPLGFNHKATADFAWNGYHIPKGATILGNHWALSRDPDMFPDPEKFDTQRWLDAQGKLRPQNEIRYFYYGFGRRPITNNPRVCPGQYVANRSLFITTALLFWAFRVSEDPSAPIDPNALDGGLIAHSLPFKVVFEPRRNVEEIKQAMRSAD